MRTSKVNDFLIYGWAHVEPPTLVANDATPIRPERPVFLPGSLAAKPPRRLIADLFAGCDQQPPHRRILHVIQHGLFHVHRSKARVVAACFDIVTGEGIAP